MKILLADDDLVTLKLLEKHIQSWGHDVYSAQNGLDAWDLAGSDDFDLVITDWNMPGMTGIEFIIQLERRQYGAQVVMNLVEERTGNLDSNPVPVPGPVPGPVPMPADNNVMPSDNSVMPVPAATPLEPATTWDASASQDTLNPQDREAAWGGPGI